MSDRTLAGDEREKSVNDPDDISAMAGYMLMANQFDTRGIVVASTHRKQHKSTPDQAKWTTETFGSAYHADVKNLNRHLGGFPDTLTFTQSCIKESGERFSPSAGYQSLEQYSTVRSLVKQVRSLAPGEFLNILCWGSLTEPAIFVRHCLSTYQPELLKRVRFIAHWTNSSLHQGTREHPERVANCREDALACAYMKHQAASAVIQYYECGAIGQHGIVSGSPKGSDYYAAFRTSQLGTIFVDGKFVCNSVDHSDSATFWALLGNWGVSLDDIRPDGTNPVDVEQRNEDKFRSWSHRIHNELLRRSKIAAGLPEQDK